MFLLVGFTKWLNIVYLKKHNKLSHTSSKHSQKSYKIFLIVVWVASLIIEIIKCSWYASLHDNRIWLYLPLHVCSLSLFLLPILIFTKSNTKLHQVSLNFTLITLFLCTVTFAFGIDTPNIVSATSDTPIFYAYHSYTWHILLTILFAYFVIFGKERMYRKLHLSTTIAIFSS